jgi:hypothetical protein
MAKTIPQLTDATTVNAADELIIQQGGITKRATGAELAKGLNAINGTVNVKDFGAVGDGVADDAAAIQAAANAVLSEGCLFIPSGTYFLSTNVSVLNKRVLAHGAVFTGAGSLTAPLLETVTSNVVRTGSYLAVGKAANTDTTGKGGLLVGGGTSRSPNGVWLSLDGASNWLVAQTSKNENPTEVIVYGSSAQGYATSSSGTNSITRDWGTPFSNNWVGKTIYFLRKKFKVSTVANSNTLTVTEMDGSPVTFPSNLTEAYNYCYTTGSGLCNVSGTTITYVSGDPFVPLFFTDFEFTLNGTPVSLSSFDSVTQYTASASQPTATNVPFTWRGNINDQLTTLRVQAIQGDNEENVNLLAIAGDNFLGRHYALVAGLAGTYGQFRPIFIGSGSYTDNSYQHQIGVYPRNYVTAGQGYVSLGGVQGREGLRVYAPDASTPLANRISLQATAATFAPSFRAEGTDSDISLGMDAKGTGEFRVTQNFARTLFVAGGLASTVNWIQILASTTGNPAQVTIDANSADANVDLHFTPKGTGVVGFGTHSSLSGETVTGFITIKDATGNTRKLAVVS